MPPINAQALAGKSSSVPPPLARPKPVTPPPLPPEALLPVPPTAAVAGGVSFSEREMPLSPAGGMPRWMLWTAAPVAAVLVFGGAWAYRAWRPAAPSAKVAVVPAVAAPATADTPAPAVPVAEAVPSAVPRRWIPNSARMIVTVRPSHWSKLLETGPVEDRLAPLWRPTLGALLRGLGLKLESVRRATWAVTDLVSAGDSAVAVIELETGHDAHALTRAGKPVGITLGQSPCVAATEPDAPWRQPLAAVDDRTIVTGPAELLRALAQQNNTVLESRAIDRLLRAVVDEPSWGLWLDLTAARSANWSQPAAWLDPWPNLRRPWNATWEMADGLGVTVQAGDQLASEADVVCLGPTATERVRAALDELLPEARKGLATAAESLPKQLQEGRIGPDAAGHLGPLLQRAATTLAGARLETTGEIVRLRMSWGQKPAELSKSLLAGHTALEDQWLAAASGGDEANHQRLLGGLQGFRKAEGHFPAASEAAAAMAPETRLSWIANLLPYLGPADWRGQLEFGYPWNGPQNRKVAQRPLDAVVNPALGLSLTEAGFPVTHYVGVAGWGADAGSLKASDPRAGVFGYGRNTRLEDITDGASNTIAILGVSGHLGAWAAGGSPTARPLTKAPYVNGPDGFGSGQTNGMLAGMADGSVRFISKDIDPRILEQLATIHGAEPVTVAALDPHAAPAAVAAAIAPSGTASGKPILAAIDVPAAANVLPPPALKNTAPEPDVDKQLAMPLGTIHHAGVPVGEVLKLAADLTNLRITLDYEAMTRLGVGLGDRVSVQIPQATVRDLLNKVLQRRGLVLVTDNNLVLVTSPASERNTLRTVSYPVGDLIRDEAQASQHLLGMLRELVAPESWQSAGGQGNAVIDGHLLVVAQTAPVHDQISVFCEKLRTARKLQPTNPAETDRFALTTRLQRVAAVLKQPMTLNFPTATPLVEIAARLEDTTGALVLVDWVTLRAAGVPSNVTARLKAAQAPLDVGVEEMLRPMGLALRAVDTGVIQITTRRALATRLDLEFYDLADFVARGMPAENLAEQIRGSVAKASWNDAGGPGVLHVDGPSNCLLVLQSQPVQAAIARALDQLRSELPAHPAGK